MMAVNSFNEESNGRNLYYVDIDNIAYLYMYQH